MQQQQQSQRLCVDSSLQPLLLCHPSSEMQGTILDQLLEFVCFDFEAQQHLGQSTPQLCA
eukprot:3939439-Rhodomonas_salina.2